MLLMRNAIRNGSHDKPTTHIRQRTHYVTILQTRQVNVCISKVDQ